ncbi:ABC transporter ATP-binding protein [bacterium BRH_c32]|jgi:phospholipid/cholesterol/gamma-HCH transport system ATP-binding protein|nr:MAG: ABC transporter ATP-binding protein [bacterium BRH_c32]
MTDSEIKIKSSIDNSPEEIVVEMQHLKKSFGNNDVLKDINLCIKKRENLVILGQSGTGKSVLIKCIVGLIEIDNGKLIIFGKDVSELKQKELIKIYRRIGFLFQSGALYDSMSVRENLEFPLRRQIDSMKKEELDILIQEALHEVGLDEAIDKTPSELSGGMRKRLGLARTLILRPEIMLYDEPTTGLDPITSKEISNLIIAVQEKYHTSSIIITHDIECARLTANRIIVLKDGVCAAEGSFEELEKSTYPWIRSFFE